MHILGITWDQIVAVFAAGAFEGTGVPWPGAVVMAIAGIASDGNWHSIALLATLFSLAYCLGALAQYLFGRVLGRVTLKWLSENRRTQLQNMMDKHGTFAVLWTRPFAIGNYISIPAGMMKMPVPQFLLYTFVGCWPWAFGVVYLGHYVGTEFAITKSLAKQLTLPSVLVLGGLFLLAAAWKFWRHRQSTRTLPRTYH